MIAQTEVPVMACTFTLASSIEILMIVLNVHALADTNSTVYLICHYTKTLLIEN